MQFQDVGEWVGRVLARRGKGRHRAGGRGPRWLAPGAASLALAACAALPMAATAAASVAATVADGRAAAEPWPAVVTYVVDGDSIWVRSVEGRARVKLRLLGIDAPEVCQSQGAQARAALQKLALNQPVRVTVRARDRYGRALATVQRAADGLDLSQAMVAAGWAWADRFGGHHAAYEPAETAARQAQRGVFGQAAAELPADFRRRHGPCPRAKP